MKLALLTSNHIRHMYFAEVLKRHHDLRLVVAEEKGNQSQYSGSDNAESEILRKHFERRDEEHQTFFGPIKDFPSDRVEVVHVSRGGVNTSEIVAKIQAHSIEGIAVFGCGILHERVFDLCPNRVINAHQGLSPYYRGSGTNFWPFVFRELQCVGVTIHYIDAGIDTGGIICHGRPEIEKHDTMHNIGCKTIVVSAKLMVKVFQILEQGTALEGIPQWAAGRLFQRKDFNAQAVLRVEKNLQSGMVDEYVERLNQDKQPKIQFIDIT